MELRKLRTLHMEKPIGIDQTPYFSWILTSEEQNVLQTACRLALSRGDEIIWDSGKVECEQSTFVAYAGPALQSRTRYTWAVTVWDNQGNEAGASAWFETAFLSPDDWKAKWAVSPLPFEDRKKNFGNQPPATLFRRGFTLKGEVAQARLYATCHGIYRLSVNGLRPDDREFAPENTSYKKYLCYQTYDVTALLRSGENALGVYVGDGWYCSPLTMPRENKNTEPHAVLFQLELRYADGSEEIVCSDKKVKAAHGPVLFSDLYAGEKYDANAEMAGWDTPEFSDDGWTPARIKNFGYANLAAQIGNPVRPVVTLPAVRTYRSPKGEQIVDFGQNLAGRIRMKVNAPKGREITLDHFEAPDRDGNYFNNILVTYMGPTCEQRVVYISDGKPREFEALFTFQGFQYVRVTGLDEVRAEDFCAVALSSDNENVGTFECSDSRLNRLYENTRWSQRSNMLSIPTDCPQREKAGWTGDAQIYAATAFLNEDMTSFYTRWLRSLTCEQASDGRVPIIVPYYKYYTLTEIFNKMDFKEKGMYGTAAWGDAAVIVPYMMYLMTGNTAVLRAQYDSMKAWCEYVIRTAANRRGNKEIPKEIDQFLWNTGFHYGEWMIPSLSKTGYDSKSDKEKIFATKGYIAPIFGWYSVSLLSKIACLLGEEVDTAYYTGIAAKMKDAFQKGVIDQDGNMPLELQGAYVLPIYFDLVPEQHKQHFADMLVRLIEENGGCLDTGFLGTPYLLDALCKIGRTDMAYDLLYQEKGPSWLDQLKNGATTIWESWYCYDENGDPLAMSMNHYAFGCVDDWLFRYIGGVEREGIGFKHVKIQPRPDASLRFAKRTFLSEYGEIVCEWEKKDDKFHLTVAIPCNTTATVLLPDGTAHEIGSGSYTFIVNQLENGTFES